MSDYPYFSELIQEVVVRFPIQKKAIELFAFPQGDDYWKFGERVSVGVSKMRDVSPADAYRQLCLDLMTEQRHFDRTGEYRQTQRGANDQIYSQPDTMRPYVVGLMLSYLFWQNHYEMMKFYIAHLPQSPRYVLDVGAGHGLFSVEMLRENPEVYLDIVDISEASLQLTHETLQAMGVYPAKVLFRHGDFLTETFGEHGYDFLIMGEIIEHVEDVQGFLQKASSLLRHGGKIFLSTCANCPAPDHVYQFHSVNEIRETIYRSGLVINSDLALPTLSTTVNYCAILSREI